MEELEGTFNTRADSIKRINETWSDTNLDGGFTETDSFTRLQCRNCGGISFEVLNTGDYETSAQCNNCGMYYIVHTG